MFIDFAALKAAVSFEDAVNTLGLDLKQVGNQWRGECPACKTGGDRALVITEGKGWFCFAAKGGGDVIALVAHIQGVTVKDAAKFLAGGMVNTGTVSKPTSTSTSSQEPRQPPKPAPAPQATPDPAPKADDNKLEKVAARLLHEHEEVQALGISPATAEALCIGYDRSGILRGRVLFPLYRDGHLEGFFGYAADLEPIIKFPKAIADQPVTAHNVVKLVQKAR